VPHAQDPRSRTNTVAMLGHAYSLLGFRIVDGVVGAGFPQRPAHSAVFAQIDPEGSRLSELAHRANMTPQAMGELVDQLESLGYLVRRPDPRDRRAKLIGLTARGKSCVEAAQVTIAELEDEISRRLGEQGHRQLRLLLEKLLAEN
jgi:DNA-binding MarR family transcriptional regulator